MIVGWLKNKPHLLIAAVGAGTNYEMIVKCYFGSGTDGTEVINGETIGKVYLNSLCNPDFSDVRFVSPDGNTVYSQKRISYISSSYALFIFKVTESLSVNESISVWYCNPSAVDVSSDLATDGVLSGLVGAWNFDVSDIEVSPVVIADDNQAAFWTNDAAKMVVTNETTIKLHGVDSAKIVCLNETDLGGIIHTYGGAQDWSAKNKLSFDFYGANSGHEFWILVYVGSVSHIFGVSFIDNFIGWKHISFPLSSFSVLAGAPAWSGVTSILFVAGQASTSGTVYLDRVIVDVDNFCADSSGNGNHGTLYGANNGTITGATRVAGKYGNGLSFDRTSDNYGIIPASSSLTMTTDFTVCFWAKIPSTPAVYGRVLDNGYAANKNWAIVQNSGFTDLLFDLFFTDSSAIERSTVALGLNTWAFVVLGVSGTNMVISVNNASPALYSLGGKTVDYAQLAIGIATSYIHGSGADATIILDDLRYFNRALSSGEVTSLFNNVRVDSGLVGEWLFEETSGATAFDTHLKTVSGKYGDALNGDGLSVYAAIPSVASLNLANKLTLTAWIKPNSSGQAGAGRIFGKNDPADYGLLFNGNSIWFMGNSTTLGYSAANSVPLNQWSFVAVTFDKDLPSNQISLYVNGVLSGVATKTTALSATQSIVYIGDRSDHIVHFNGLIDEAKILNVALTSAQITALYNASPKSKYVLNLALTEGSGTYVVDASGNGNNGVFVGTPTWITGGVRFSESGQYISIANSPSLNVCPNFTLAAKVKMLSYVGTVNAIISKLTYAAGAGGYELGVWGDGRVYLTWVDSVTYGNTFFGGAISLGVETHIAVTVIGVAAQFYINGSASGALQTLTSAPSNNPCPLTIGCRYGGGWISNAEVKNPCIYNRALSSTEITALYNNSPYSYEDVLLLPGSVYIRKWGSAVQPAHSTWSPEVSWWGLSRLSSLVVLPIVNNIMPRGGCNVDVFTQDGSIPILNVTSQTEDMLSLQGSICIPNQNDDMYLITNYLLPLIAMKGKAVTLYSPNALFDGEWLFRDYSFPKVAEGAFARYRFTLNFSKGDSINEL